jgi:hypothetical protein
MVPESLDLDKEAWRSINSPQKGVWFACDKG